MVFFDIETLPIVKIVIINNQRSLSGKAFRLFDSEIQITHALYIKLIFHKSIAPNEIRRFS